MRTTLSVVAACLALAACTSEPPEPEPEPVPRPVPLVQGDAGEPVTLEHEAEPGDVVQVFVQPLPMVSCSSSFRQESPSGDVVDLPTHDPTTRMDEAGVWSWTYEPCPGDRASYTLRGVPMRDHELELDGPAVTLETHATYDDIATFEPPEEGRVILLGAHRGLVGPTGARAQGYGTRVVFEDGRLVAPVAPEVTGAWTVVGADAEVRLVTPPVVDAEVDGPPVALGPVGGWEVGEHVVEFSVEEPTWLSSRLIGWAAAPGERGLVVVESRDGQPDPTRSEGVWHLQSGAYAARVTAGQPGDHGSFGLRSVQPVVVSGPGETRLTAGPGSPGLVVFDLPGDHPVDVIGPGAGTTGWSLTWAADEPPASCSSALSCMAVRAPTLPHDAPLGPRISHRGYLVLTSTDDGTHAVTVRIGRH